MDDDDDQDERASSLAKGAPKTLTAQRRCIKKMLSDNRPPDQEPNGRGSRKVRYLSLALDDSGKFESAIMNKKHASDETHKEFCTCDKEKKVASSPTVFPAQQHSEEKNPLYELSNEYMKIIGGQQMFKTLLKRHGEQRASPTKSDIGKRDQTQQSRGGDKSPSKAQWGITGIILESDWTVQLRKRKLLFYRRIRINDYCFFMALTGIAIVVLKNEFATLNQDPVWTAICHSISICVTIALVVGIFMYHATQLQISLNRTGADDWRVAMTRNHFIQLCTEILVCSIVPLPGIENIHEGHSVVELRFALVNFVITWTVIKEDRLTAESVSAPLNAVLSILMLCRLYLLGRFMALRSKQFQDAATRSIAALNRITVDFAFILRSLMYEHPVKVLLLFTAVLWIVMAWMFRQCERYNGSEEEYLFSNAIWFIIITFLSIGYGDITPRTYCGRGVSITTGIIGAGVSSAVIAVISRQMELTRAEKQVNNFMSETKLSKTCKHVAAKVLQNRWFIHKYSNAKTSYESAKLRGYQKRFLAAINEFKHVKWEQRKTNEEGNALIDVAKMQKTMHEALFDMKKTQEMILCRLEILCHQSQQMNPEFEDRSRDVQ